MDFVELTAPLVKSASVWLGGLGWFLFGGVKVEGRMDGLGVYVFLFVLFVCLFFLLSCFVVVTFFEWLWHFSCWFLFPNTPF